MPRYKITSAPPPPVLMLELRLTIEEANDLARDFVQDRLVSRATSGVLTAISAFRDKAAASARMVEDKT